MIDRLDTRREIARRRAEAAKQREQVNRMPDVIAAREVAESARHAANEAEVAFRRAFDSHYPRGDDIDAELMEDHDDLFVLGDTSERHMFWPAFCAVTGLPIFVGDRVIETSDVDAADYERQFVLADAVIVDPALLGPSARLVIAGEHGDTDIATDEDEAA